MCTRCLLFVLLVLGFIVGPVAARADAASDWVRNDHAAVRLIAAGPPAADGAVSLGLEFELKPGWHIYWRAPGDAGIPPIIDWTGSENFAAPQIAWPLPERYTIFGLTTFVYGGHVVLPIDARAAQPGAPVRLRAKVNYLACEKICIPYDATLALNVDGATPATQRATIDAFRAQVPKPVSGGNGDFTVTSARLLRDGENLALEVLVRSADPLRAPDIMVEGPRGLRFGPPQMELAADARSVLFRLPALAAGEGVPESPRLTMTLADRGRTPVAAVEQSVIADATDAARAATGLAAILLIALLGGLILNLMPCVLPVLSLKLLSVVGHGGDTGAVRRGFLFTAAGIVFSFLVLAAGAIALKATGAAVGWGIQFQSPVFLGLMAVVMTLFAANLFGFFEIAMPGFAGHAAASAPTGGPTGAFVTGAFATLLATPCSAPFLGTAIGFALSRGYGEIVAVFLALGIGLALPYLAVAAFPALARAMPRPGRWMAGLRLVLGLALVGTAAWLITVIDVVAGARGAIAIAAALVGLLALFAARRYLALPRGPLRAVIALTAAVAVALPALLSRPEIRSAAVESIPWRPFDKVALYNLVAEGKTVFVDVTAEWCVTCKANKALVIDRGAVARALTSGAVVPMRADWTRPDPAISAYLASFGRFGIPFNAVYGPARPSGIALPELLTEGAVLQAIDRAKAK